MVIGYSGSGKSTLAKYLKKKYQIPVLHLDQLFWLPGWEARPREEMQDMVARFMDTHSSWVIEGNYSKTEYVRRLEEADRIVFLGFNRFSCLYRVWKRYIRYKGRTRTDMGKGCMEKLDWEFIWWILFKGRDKNHKKEYQAVVKQYRAKVVVIHNQRKLNAFYKNPAVNQ